MQSNMGVIKVPAESTTPIVINVGFTPKTFIICGHCNNCEHDGKGFLTTTEQGCWSQGLTSWDYEPDVCMLVTTSGSDELVLEGAITPNTVTLTPTTNDIALDVWFLWQATD